MGIQACAAAKNMERSGEENWEKEKFIAEVRDFFDFDRIKDSVKEEYCFKPTGKVSESTKDLGDLARKEKYYNRKKEEMEWSPKDELRRCELKKNLESEILDLNPQEMANFWLKVETIFCDKFDGKEGKEEKNPLPPLKRRTYLDEEENSNRENTTWSREAKDSFKSLKGGIESEKIARDIFTKVLKAEESHITNSKTDIEDKIDLVVFFKNVILLLQVKTKMLNLMEKSNTELIREIKSDAEELDKKAFFKGYKKIEKSLGLENKGVIKEAWLTIPTEWKTGKGTGYDERLASGISVWCQENIIKN